MSGRFYKYVFIAAGLLNFAIATVLIFFTDLFVILFHLGAQPIQPVFAHLVGTLAFSLGVTYLWISKNGCGLCVQICPVGALEMVDKVVHMKPPEEHECFMCGACYSICPPKAIQTVAGAGFAGRFSDIDRGPLTLPMLELPEDTELLCWAF